MEAVEYAGSTSESDSTTLAAASDDYSIGTDLTISDCLRIRSVSCTGGGLTHRLKVVSPNQIIEWREATPSGGPAQYFALEGLDKIMLYPRPSVGDVLTVRYVELPPTLVESGPTAGQESTPTKVPARWHQRVLLNGLVYKCLQRDQRSEDWLTWKQEYETGLVAFREWCEMYAGEATPLWQSDRDGLVLQRDQKWGVL